MENGFLMKHGGQFSINDLIGLTKERKFVMRTGHLGNHYLSNLLLLSCGIPSCLFDRNRLMKDRNFWPSKIIVDGAQLALAEEEDVFVPFSRFVENLNGTGAYVGDHRNPAQVHAESMKTLFGNLVFTESQFYELRIPMVAKIAEHMSAVAPELFLRMVNAKGVQFNAVRQTSNVSRNILKANQVMHNLTSGVESEFDAGIVPEVQATIIMNGILGYHASAFYEMYELSGPDMVKYSLGQSFGEKIHAVYEALREKMPELPETIIFHVIPSFSFRFGSLASESVMMDEWWNSLKKFREMKVEKRELKKKLHTIIPAGNKRELSGKMQEALAPINSHLASLAKSILTSPLTGRIAFTLEKGDFFSQYDLIASGETLYVPEEVKSIPLNEVEKYHQLLNEIRKDYEK